MIKTDQMPSGGCAICGAYAGEPQYKLRKTLSRSGSYWLCNACMKNENL